MKILLSVDWDYFFPNLMIANDRYREKHPERGNEFMYDWMAGEYGTWRQYFLNGIWSIRASNFKIANIALPEPWEEYKYFFQRFTFSDQCKLYIAESHECIYRLIRPGEYGEVWNFDAHHDAGYLNKTALVTCDNWAEDAVARGIDVHWRYPDWLDSYTNDMAHAADILTTVSMAAAGDEPEIVHDVFVCRSGAWSPAWLDLAFIEFVNSSGMYKNERQIIDIHESNPMLLRPYDDGMFDDMDDIPDRIV